VALVGQTARRRWYDLGELFTCSSKRSTICSAVSSRRTRSTSRCARIPTSSTNGRHARVRVEPSSTGPTPSRRARESSSASRRRAAGARRAQFMTARAVPDDRDGPVSVVGKGNPAGASIRPPATEPPAPGVRYAATANSTPSQFIAWVTNAKWLPPVDTRWSLRPWTRRLSPRWRPGGPGCRSAR